MSGETTLPTHNKVLGIRFCFPPIPWESGEPDRVFVQEANGPMTILVWLDPQQPGQVKMSLHFIPQGSWAVDKFAPAGNRGNKRER